MCAPLSSSVQFIIYNQKPLTDALWLSLLPHSTNYSEEKRSKKRSATRQLLVQELHVGKNVPNARTLLTAIFGYITCYLQPTIRRFRGLHLRNVSGTAQAGPLFKTFRTWLYA